MPLPPDSYRRGWMPAGFVAVAIFCAAAALSFVLAMYCFPGGYNPLMRMLSALGRTEVRLVERPWSHYLFMAGMFFAMLAVASAAHGPSRSFSRLRRWRSPSSCIH